MDKQFRFRYANEIAGAFVLLTLALLLAGIFVAGHAQGWFERKLILQTRFDTEEGAFGLQEGDEIRISNLKAGRIGRISPQPDGMIVATLEIQNRFRSLVRQGAVAKVRKIWGVAGDALVEIDVVKGDPLRGGDWIPNKKNEELMEMAKKVLDDVQKVVLPIMDETKGILSNLNSITKKIEKGEGLAGAVLNDKGLADDVKSTVAHVEGLVDSVKGSLGHLDGLVVESREAVGETKRLIQGVQQHWLWRRYMDKKEPSLAPVGVRALRPERAIRALQAELDAGRTANDSPRIARSAYNLAVAYAGQERWEEARSLVEEARREFAAAGENTACTYLLEADVARRSGDTEAAGRSIQAGLALLDRSTDPEMALQCRAMAVDLWREWGKTEEAKAELKRVNSLARKVERDSLKAIAAGVSARLLRTEGKDGEAAGQFDAQAVWLGSAGLYPDMADALACAATSYEKAGKAGEAADRFFRAGRSLHAAGDPVQADALFDKALAVSAGSGDPYIRAAIGRFRAAASAEKKNAE